MVVYATVDQAIVISSLVYTYAGGIGAVNLYNAEQRKHRA